MGETDDMPDGERSSPQGRAGGRGPSWRARLALVAVSLLLAVGGAEIALRLFAHLPTTHHRLFCEYDELLGWRKVPGASGWHITSEYRVLEEFNSRGLRGPEYSYEKPDGVFRVLVLGDSFVEGYSVAYEDVFTERLRRLLEERTGRPVEVINAGTGGYSTDQELLFFRTEGRRYEPDLTVLTFYENDPLYNTQDRFFRGSKPVFELRPDGRLELTNVPPEPPRRSARRRAVDWTLDHVRVARLASLAIRGNRIFHDLAVKLGITSPWHAFDASTGVPFEHTVYVSPPPAEVEHAWRVTEALLVELRREVEEAGGELLVIYAPSIQVADGDLCRILTRAYDFEDRGCDERAVSKRLGEILARHGIDFLDPSPALAAEGERLAGTGRELYFREDGHWTEEANRLVAELLERRILPLAQRRGASTRLAERRRDRRSGPGAGSPPPEAAPQTAEAAAEAPESAGKVPAGPQAQGVETPSPQGAGLSADNLE